jgi:polysaccharide export outer membrane protein
LKFVQGGVFLKNMPPGIEEFIKSRIETALAVSLLVIALASASSAQEQTVTNRVGAESNLTSDGPNLSQGKLGGDDLIGISVYDSPELSHTVRVGTDGTIRLPMVRQHIQVAGLVPAELETAIATALIDEHVMVDPIVSVTVVEYHSRPITVVGAVRAPITFQAAGTVTLLDAIVRAGGIGTNAGSDILVTHPSSMTGGTSISLTERIPVHSLMDVSDPASNLKLEGGENIRVPEAGQVYVVGNVKRPGPFLITDGSESSVLKALAMSGGLDSFASHTAYIYRVESISGRKNQIPIEIKKILARKTPDVPLYGNDMLYIPNRSGLRTSAKALEIATGVGLGVVALLIYVIQ